MLTCRKGHSTLQGKEDTASLATLDTKLYDEAFTRPPKANNRYGGCKEF